MGAVVKYYITDAEKAFFGAQNLDHTLRVTAQSATAKCIGKVEEKQLTENRSIADINTTIKVCYYRLQYNNIIPYCCILLGVVYPCHW